VAGLCVAPVDSAARAPSSHPMDRKSWTSANSARTTLRAPTSAADPCSVTLIQSVNNRIRRAQNAKNPRRNIAGQAEGELKFLSVIPIS